MSEAYAIPDIKSPPSPRVAEARAAFIARDPEMCCERALIYTDVYQEYRSLPLIIRRGMALKETLRKLPIFIEDTELIVGHPASKPRSAEVFPDVNIKIMEEIDVFPIREHNRLKVQPAVKEKLMRIWPFWKGNTITDFLNALRPDEVRTACAYGLLSNPHEWSGFGHVCIEYEQMLSEGVDGMLRRIDALEKGLSLTDPHFGDKSAFYKAGRYICEGLLIFAGRYRDLALAMAKKETREARKAELLGIADVLSRVPRFPAESFREAMQSFWFAQLIPQIESNGFSISPGRFDTYMWPYLKKDLDEKKLTIAEAQELTDLLFLKFAEILRVDSRVAAEIGAGYGSGQNVLVGGVDRAGHDSTNLVSYLCLSANAHVRLHQPNFSVRLHRDTPDDFLAAVTDSISCGNGMPQLFNDEVIRPALISHKMPPDMVWDYDIVGCSEASVSGTWGRCNGGYINFAKVLEYTLNEGKDAATGVQVGLPVSVSACENFDAFLDVFAMQMKHAIQLHLCDVNLTDCVHRQLTPLPFVSMYVRGCLENGKDVTDGGAIYNHSGPVGVGTATVADSLMAIRRIVYDDKKWTIDEFCDSVKEDFANDETLRQFILNRIPKFGNDVDDVDQYAVWLSKIYFEQLEMNRNYHGGDLWPAFYSVSAQIGFGSATGTTPDGRLSGLPLSDGLTPMYGMDRSGPTAALNSVVKVEQQRAPNGIIVNQRLVKSLFDTRSGKDKVAQLLRAFVRKASFHWQFNIVDSETLRDAQKNPENYRGLVVRVAGYSAIFNELSEKAQNSIIERYEADL